MVKGKQLPGTEPWKCSLMITAYQTEASSRRCRFYPNDTYSCEEAVTESPEKWSEHKRKLDELIAETRRRLKDLKVSILYL